MIKNIKKGFTLVEALVAMGITAALLGLGTVGIMSFRATVELQNANSDTFSFIRTLQNRARNSVSFTLNGEQVIPDYYGFTVSGSDLLAQYCQESGSTVTCAPLPQQLNQNISEKISLDFDCEGILFSTLNENIFELSNNTLVDDSQCQLRIIHTSNSNSRNINFDLAKNTVDDGSEN
jgi:type II secretory pathway pseudopilin PulG